MCPRELDAGSIRMKCAQAAWSARQEVRDMTPNTLGILATKTDQIRAALYAYEPDVHKRGGGGKGSARAQKSIIRSVYTDIVSVRMRGATWEELAEMLSPHIKIHPHTLSKLMVQIEAEDEAAAKKIALITCESLKNKAIGGS